MIKVKKNCRQKIQLCPKNRRVGGHIVFGADPVGLGIASAFGFHALSSEPVD